MAYGVLPGYTPIANTDSIQELALAAARRAVASDSTLGDAHLALANSLNSMNPALAEPAFQKALALQPEDATTHQWHGDNLEALGRLEEALAEERRAQQLDPLSAVIATELSAALYYIGRIDESIIAARRALEIDPTFVLAEWQLATSYIFLHRPDSAIRILERSYARDPRAAGARSGLVAAYAAAGRWADAERLRQEIERPGNSVVTPGDKLTARMVFRDLPGAFAVFEQMTRTRSTQTAFGCDPLYAPLRKDPRFATILNRVGAKVCATTTPWPIPSPPPQYQRK
jgi:tetratricopeptide (TPR) repeat protein